MSTKYFEGQIVSVLRGGWRTVGRISEIRESDSEETRFIITYRYLYDRTGTTMVTEKTLDLWEETSQEYEPLPTPDKVAANKIEILRKENSGYIPEDKLDDILFGERNFERSRSSYKYLCEWLMERNVDIDPDTINERAWIQVTDSSKYPYSGLHDVLLVEDHGNTWATRAWILRNISYDQLMNFVDWELSNNN